MPNWVINRVIMPGIEKEDLFSDDGNFDFSKLVPMPESLNVIAGGEMAPAILSYLSVRGIIRTKEALYSKAVRLGLLEDGKTYSFGDPHRDIWDAISCTKQMDEHPAEWDGCSVEEPWWNEPVLYRAGSDEKITRYEFGKLLCENFLQYGATNWYDWSVEKWGTKWNASATQTSKDILIFNTAWSVPDGALKALSVKYPDREIKVTWADEDQGYNTGEGVLLNGQWIALHEPEGGSSEGLRLYVGLWGDSPCIGTDENGNLFHRSCDRCDGCGW